MEGRKIIQWSLVGLGVAIVVIYSYFVLDDYVRGPRIVIDTPQSGYSTTSPAIMVVGRGIHTNNLTVNGAQTPVDLDGNFRSQLILADGYNIIKITGKDNYDRTVEETIEIVLKKEKLTTDTTTELTNSPAGRAINENTSVAETHVSTSTEATTTINQF